MGKFVALLRAINVGGHNKVPMDELRTVAKEVGYPHVQTYIASGNLVLESTDGCASIESTLEQAIEQRFGFPGDVIVRSEQQWAAYARKNPFPHESETSPRSIMLCIGKRRATDADLSVLKERARGSEKVKLQDDVLWLHLGEGAARSKLAFTSREGVWTIRNWTTVVRLAEMLEASG